MGARSGEDDDPALLRYYPDRTAWVVEPDATAAGRKLEALQNQINTLESIPGKALVYDLPRKRKSMSGSRPEVIHVVGICGSIRSGSFTRMALAETLAGAAAIGAATLLINLGEYRLPFVTAPDGPEQQSLDVQRLRAETRSADGIILATPEYHGNFSGVLKNAIDLMGFEEFEGKMLGLIGVSGGRMGASDALNTLRGVGRALRAWVLPQQVSIPEAWSAFDSDGSVKDAQLRRRLRDTGAQVARFARVHKWATAEEFVQLWQKAPENPGGEAR